MSAPQAYETPGACALSGFSPASGAQVVAEHVQGDYAVAYVVTGSPESDWLSVVRRDADGWHELGGGSGGLQWHDDESGIGVLGVVWSVAAPGTYSVSCPGGEPVTVAARGGHVVAVLVGVDADCLPVVRRVGD